jgi:hypothetical protein
VFKQEAGNRMNKLTYDEIIRLMAAKKLSKTFNRWDAQTLYGATVAHFAAEFGYLPENFTQWELARVGGWAVAHTAARFGHLPANFTQWDIADEDGWTVAHIAAQYGPLPASFNNWDCDKDKLDKGHTPVAHVAAEYGNLPADFNQWDIKDSTGETVAQLVPELYMRWKVINEFEHSEPENMSNGLL